MNIGDTYTLSPTHPEYRENEVATITYISQKFLYLYTNTKRLFRIPNPE